MATLALVALFLPLVHGACMSLQMCTDYTQTYNPGATAGYYCEGPAPATIIWVTAETRTALDALARRT